MSLINRLMIATLKVKSVPKQHFRSKQHAQSSGLSSVVLFVPFGSSSRSFLPPFRRHFTRSLAAFGRAITSTIPLHCVTLRKLRYTAFQQYHVCRPLFFQRWRSSHSHRGLAPLPSPALYGFIKLLLIQ